jgi:hypothetical protein
MDAFPVTGNGDEVERRPLARAPLSSSQQSPARAIAHAHCWSSKNPIPLSKDRHMLDCIALAWSLDLHT